MSLSLRNALKLLSVLFELFDYIVEETEKRVLDRVAVEFAYYIVGRVFQFRNVVLFDNPREPFNVELYPFAD